MVAAGHPHPARIGRAAIPVIEEGRARVWSTRAGPGRSRNARRAANRLESTPGARRAGGDANGSGPCKLRSGSSHLLPHLGRRVEEELEQLDGELVHGAWPGPASGDLDQLRQPSCGVGILVAQQIDAKSFGAFLRDLAPWMELAVRSRQRGIDKA